LMAHGMTSLSKAGRRGIDGGLPCPKTCQIVPPRLEGGTWEARCTSWDGFLATGKSCRHVDEKPSRAEVIVAHREHVKAEHGEVA
jgi:hypothetical protein